MPPNPLSPIRSAAGVAALDKASFPLPAAHHRTPDEAGRRCRNRASARRQAIAESADRACREEGRGWDLFFPSSIDGDIVAYSRAAARSHCAFVHRGHSLDQTVDDHRALGKEDAERLKSGLDWIEI